MNREKVIEAFDDAKELVWLDDDEYTVGYNNGIEAGKNIALVLLNEQEAKTGHCVSVNDGDVVAIDNDGFPERACFCSECKKYLIAFDEYAVYGRYCPFCGAKMEGR